MMCELTIKSDIELDFADFSVELLFHSRSDCFVLEPQHVLLLPVGHVITRTETGNTRQVWVSAASAQVLECLLQQVK